MAQIKVQERYVLASKSSQWYRAALGIYIELGFTNLEILTTTFKLLEKCLESNKFDIKISRSNDNEILIHRDLNGIYNNLLIDAEGDVTYMRIAKKIENAHSKVFFHSDGFDFDEIVRFL